MAGSNPRLLAYGGMRFSERRRIGEWPPIPEGTLRDPYGLQTSCWSFGAGTAGGGAFLILRRLVHYDSRFYAFTLLLDPGQSVWTKFEWNGAAILDRLIRAEEGREQSLFVAPEECTESALHQVLDGLPAMPAANGLRGLDRFESMLAGSAALGDPLVVNLSQLGWNERPDCGAVSRQIENLPACFRLSQGWLVGGGLLHGEVFGARLVIDDSTDTPDSNRHGAESEGRRYVAAWTRLADEAALEPLRNQPMIAWPAGALDSLTLLSDLRQAEELSDDLLRRSKLGPAPLPALNEAIEERKVFLLLSGTAPLGPSQTLELTGTVLRMGLTLDEKQTGRLHSPTLVRYLAEHFETPASIPETFAIPWGVRLELWDLAIRNAAEGRILAVFSQAIETESEIESLVNRAIQRLTLTDESLAGWRVFQTRAKVWHHLEEQLRKTALIRLERGVSGAAEDYLQVADDPGGLLAADLLPSHESAAALVRGIWRLEPKHPKLVRSWIEKLAESPLRARLPIGLKEEFAGHKGWQSLAVLKRLLAGEALGKDTPPQSAMEQAFLIAELKQMPLPAKPTRKLSDRLKKLLGREWQGFPGQDAPLNEAPPPPVRSSAGEFVRMFGQLVFNPPEKEDSFLRALDRMRTALRACDLTEAQQEAGALVMNADAAAIAPFLERFGGEYLYLGNVMDFLPLDARLGLIEHLEASGKKQFTAQAVRDLKFAINQPGSRNSYVRALGRYVLDRPGLLKNLAGRMGDWRPARLSSALEDLLVESKRE